MTRRTGNVEILTEDVLLIHPDDANKELINDGDFVCVESPRGKVDIKAKITDIHILRDICSILHKYKIMGTITTLMLVIKAELVGEVASKP